MNSNQTLPMTGGRPVVKRTSRSTVRNSPTLRDTNDKYSKLSYLKLQWGLFLSLLVIACTFVALVNRQRAELDQRARAHVGDIGSDRHSLCKEHSPFRDQSQELWTEMRDRFRLLPNDVDVPVQPAAGFWKRPPPTAPWTDRCATSSYRASQTVASMLEAQRELTSHNRGLSLDDHDPDVRPENVTQLQHVLGTCGLEFMELMTACPRQSPNNNNNNNMDTDTTQDTTAIFTLVYSVEQLDLIPENARADPRYRILDQTRNAALPDARHDGVAQFPQLFPLRHVFQAQVSELGALLAIDDALTRQTPRHETVASSSSSHSTTKNNNNMPTWVGINPIKRFLPVEVLDRLQLDPAQDATSVFFWTSCCAGQDLRTQLQKSHQVASGPDLDQLQLDIARSVFGSSYTTALPQRTWSYKGTYLMHRTLFLEFACFCKVVLAHLLDRYVTVVRRSSSGAGDDDSDMESIRPELFLKFESGNGHTNTLERTWGYFFERLINYWAYNAGYGMIMIHDTAKSEKIIEKEINRHNGRWPLLQPVTESNLTETQKRLRSCRSMFCSKPRLFSSSVDQQAQCPHLYDDRESM